jgi:hypothetical protein
MAVPHDRPTFDQIMHSLKVSGECGDVLCTHAAEEIERLQALAGAAPELLAALKLCKQALKNYIDSGYDEEEDQEAYAAAMAALSKAEGGNA